MAADQLPCATAKHTTTRSETRPFSAGLFDKKVAEKVKMGLTEYDAIIEVMGAYEGSRGTKWEKL